MVLNFWIGAIIVVTHLVAFVFLFMTLLRQLAQLKNKTILQPLKLWMLSFVVALIVGSLFPFLIGIERLFFHIATDIELIIAASLRGLSVLMSAVLLWGAYRWVEKDSKG